MHRFWEKIIKPILIVEEIKTIIEIGAEAGLNTIKLLEHCKVMNGKLYVVDPFPRFDVNAFQTAFGHHMQMMYYISHAALPIIERYDAVLIDGDHNWYTVYHELKLIENKANLTGKFPMVFLHDTEWPYGRRDMYYIPESIPEAFRKPYAKKGMVPGVSELVDVGGLNYVVNNALYENGERNGVLTAIEDFLKETSIPLTFHRAYTNNGLGILVPSDKKRDRAIEYIVGKSGL